MTKEESITMWNIEKNSADSSTFTKKMKKLFSKVEELIMSGELMYDQFSGDMLDAVTDMIIDNTNKGATLDRADQIDYLGDIVLLVYRIEGGGKGEIVIINNNDLSNYYKRKKEYLKKERNRNSEKKICDSCEPACEGVG